jgi:hypothetical protein
VAHRNARLTVHGRRLIVTRVLEEGWSPATAAEAAGVSRATVYKWLARFREHGEAGLRTARRGRGAARTGSTPSSRHGSCWPASAAGGDPHQLEFYLGVPRSTAYKVLVRNGCSRLADFDRPTGTDPLRQGPARRAAARRCEEARPDPRRRRLAVHGRG